MKSFGQKNDQNQQWIDPTNKQMQIKSLIYAYTYIWTFSFKYNILYCEYCVVKTYVKIEMKNIAN